MTASENIAPSAVDSTESLYQLIELLFPDPIPDILTLGDFETRYKLTKLGELATQAIEKSQRINHRRGNYQQIGLCEFHVGLIYFASNKYRAARQQFTLARQQWSFVDEPAADALSYFAEGVSHHFALQYELAMSKYSQARQRLSRMKFAPPSDVQNDFVQHLSSLLDIYQGHLQGKLWSHEETSETVHTSATNTPPHAGNDAPSQAGSPVPAQDTKPAPDDGDAERADAPNNNAELDDDHETILPPIIPYLPIPGHKNENPDDYKWYIIEQQQKESNIFPSSVKKGAYVLVDTRSKRASDLAITHSRRVSERMIILSHEETTKQNGRITVKPAYITQGYPRIFLGLIDGSAQPQTQTDNIPVTLSKDLQKISIHIQAILGIVIGFWLPGDNPQNESQEPS